MSDENEDTQGIANLRKNYDELTKKLAERDARLAKYEAVERASSVASVLKAKGLNEKVASLYTGDDVSEEAVGKWVDEYADVLGVTPANQPPAVDANAANAQRISDAAFGAEHTQNPPAPGTQIVGDPVELLHLMNTLPYDELVKRGFLPDVKGTRFDTHGR